MSSGRFLFLGGGVEWTVRVSLESCSCCSWIGATKGSPLARFVCKRADLIAFCEEVMIKHPHAPAYSQGPYLYGMMIYSEAG